MIIDMIMIITFKRRFLTGTYFHITIMITIMIAIISHITIMIMTLKVGLELTVPVK